MPYLIAAAVLLITATVVVIGVYSHPRGKSAYVVQVTFTSAFTNTAERHMTPSFHDTWDSANMYIKKLRRSYDPDMIRITCEPITRDEYLNRTT